MITSHHLHCDDSSPAAIICPLISWKSVLMSFIANLSSREHPNWSYKHNQHMCLLCSNFSGFSSYLDQNKNPCMIWVLIPSTTTLLFTHLIHASLTSLEYTKFLTALQPFSSRSPQLGLSASILSSNSHLPHLHVLLPSLLCLQILTPLLCFFIIMPIILQYTIVYNLLFFPSLIYLQLSLAMLNE